MKKITVLIYPAYMLDSDPLSFAPSLRPVLEGYEVKGEVWKEGDLSLLPDSADDELVLVRASNKMWCDEVDLARVCERRGFIAFSRDNLITLQGRQDSTHLVEAVSHALKKVESAARS